MILQSPEKAECEAMLRAVIIENVSVIVFWSTGADGHDLCFSPLRAFIHADSFLLL